jgi:hypothetical protein
MSAVAHVEKRVGRNNYISPEEFIAITCNPIINELKTGIRDDVI